jgi:hypothetical protein
MGKRKEKSNRRVSKNAQDDGDGGAGLSLHEKLASKRRRSGRKPGRSAGRNKRHDHKSRLSRSSDSAGAVLDLPFKHAVCLKSLHNASTERYANKARSNAKRFLQTGENKYYLEAMKNEMLEYGSIRGKASSRNALAQAEGVAPATMKAALCFDGACKGAKETEIESRSLQ